MTETERSVRNKLQTYLLNPDHGEGKEKARWFREALGFTRENLEELARQIIFDATQDVPDAQTEYGPKYRQVIQIRGANGRVIAVPFIWIRTASDDVVRLVTALPVRKRDL